MDVSAQEVRQLDDRLHDWERKNLFQLESIRPTDLRSQAESMLTHADRFRESMLIGETGRAWGIFMGVLRFHYSTLGGAIDELCGGMDVESAKQDLRKKSTLFSVMSSVFQEPVPEKPVESPPNTSREDEDEEELLDDEYVFDDFEQVAKQRVDQTSVAEEQSAFKSQEQEVEAIADLSDFGVGDRVVVTADKFSEYERKQVLKEQGDCIGQCGVIKSLEKAWIGNRPWYKVLLDSGVYVTLGEKYLDKEF